jgi:hypothetical protein
MAIKNVMWDSEARRRVEAKELDKLYSDNKDHYDTLAKETWESLHAVSEVPLYLNDGDLWDTLAPILSRDKVTQKGFVARKLPQSPMDRGGGQWFGWFTHLVVDQFLESLTEGES